MRQSHSALRLTSLGLVLVAVALAPASPNAQQQHDPVEGYITAVHLPAGFDINREHVVLCGTSTYALMGERSASSDSPLRDAIDPGVYVRVTGPYDERTHTTTALQIFVRDDWNRKLSGFGVVDRVFTPAPNLELQADGYRIRITPSTQVAYQDGVSGPAAVAANVWIHYEGKRDKDGVLLATNVAFFAPKPPAVKAVKGLEYRDIPVELPDYAQHKDGRVKIMAIAGWRKIPADQELQQRVDRIGRRLIPAYQADLPLGDPTKIPYRFFVFEDKRIRDVFCDMNGLVLVPREIVNRMRTDDQLAAILADGIAFHLQRQGAKIIKESRVLNPMLVAGDVLELAVPGANLAALAITAGAQRQVAVRWMEQRGRVALSLMFDAGFNPYQAPEAWRLAGPGKLPADLSRLKYPDLSSYQLGILNLQYRHPPLDAASSASR